jgi:dihydroflavonol-4-reductase
MKVLVTGANGFVGSHLCKQLLEKGDEVRGLVRPGSDRRQLTGVEVELVEGDVADPATLGPALEGVEIVYHTAAMVRFFVPDKVRKAMVAANVDGTRNMIEAAQQAGVKRFVHTSTIAVLKRHADGTVSDETMVADASEVIGLYEQTKLESQQIALAGATESMDVIVCNVAGPAGPGDWKPSPMGRVVQEFLKGKIPAYSNTGLCVVDVRDVAAGHILAAEKGKPGECYVLGGENIQLSDFFGLLAEVSGVKAPKVRVPYALTLIGGMMGEIQGRITGEEPLACMASVRMAKHPHYASSEKAKRELGYAPRPIRECLADEIAWLREQGMAK